MTLIITQEQYICTKKSESKVLGNFSLNFQTNLCFSLLNFVPGIILALHDQQAFLKTMRNTGVVFRKVLAALLNTPRHSSASASTVASKVGRFQTAVNRGPGKSAQSKIASLLVYPEGLG